MIPVLISVFVGGVLIGLIIGVLIGNKKINRTIKEARRQIEISKTILAEYDIRETGIKTRIG